MQWKKLKLQIHALSHCQSIVWHLKIAIVFFYSMNYVPYNYYYFQDDMDTCAIIHYSLHPKLLNTFTRTKILWNL